VAHTVPHPFGQLPGQKYVSLALQAGGVHIADSRFIMFAFPLIGS
jgi:hypothetical protein